MRVVFLGQGKIVIWDGPAQLMGSIGDWAVDYLDDSRLQTTYFHSRTETGDYVNERANSCTVRRVNLEDAFLSMTVRKMS